MILHIFMLSYRLLWVLLLPVVLVYLKRRGRKDSLYGQHIAERFGFYDRPLPQNPIWVHAVSLGELRSGVAFIRAAIDSGEKVLVTNFTPAGRRETERQFGVEIEAGQLAVSWVPFDMGWCHRRLIKACRPKICLPLEVEVWPAMIDATRKAGVPLFLCNAQYASKPLARDSRGLRIRQKVIARCAGAFVKSDVQKARFESVGLQNVFVTGELRFDQPIARELTDAAAKRRPEFNANGRKIITIASGVEAEESTYTQMIRTLRDQALDRAVPKPLFVYVPRAPERFAAIAADLQDAGLSVACRSTRFGVGAEGFAAPATEWDDSIDVLVGDSFGEMYFYLSLADKVVVGGGFTERGAHNIIEPLAVGKPAYVGPYTWTIEFPFVEAEAAGVATSFASPEAMLQELACPDQTSPETLSAFVSQHRGASQRTLNKIHEVLAGS